MNSRISAGHRAFTITRCAALAWALARPGYRRPGTGLRGANAPQRRVSRARYEEALLNPVAGAPAPEIATFFAQKTRQHHIMHFGSAIDQARGASSAVDPFQYCVLRIAACAVELDGGIGRLVQRIGYMHLGHGD